MVQPKKTSDFYMKFFELLGVNFSDKSEMNSKNQKLIGAFQCIILMPSLVLTANFCFENIDNLKKVAGGISIWCAAFSAIIKALTFFIRKERLFDLIDSVNNLETGPMNLQVSL